MKRLFFLVGPVFGALALFGCARVSAESDEAVVCLPDGTCLTAEELAARENAEADEAQVNDPPFVGEKREVDLSVEPWLVESVNLPAPPSTAPPLLRAGTSHPLGWGPGPIPCPLHNASCFLDPHLRPLYRIHAAGDRHPGGLDGHQKGGSSAACHRVGAVRAASPPQPDRLWSLCGPSSSGELSCQPPAPSASAQAPWLCLASQTSCLHQPLSCSRQVLMGWEEGRQLGCLGL